MDTSTTEIYTYVHTLSLHDALPILMHLAADALLRQAAHHGSTAVPQRGEVDEHAIKVPGAGGVGRHGAGPDDWREWCKHLGVALSQIGARSEEHTSELQSLMRISYAVFCLKKKNK